MRRLLSRLACGGWWSSVLTGAFFFVVIGRLEEPHPVARLALFGGLYALAVHGLMQLFGLRRWGRVVSGMLCAPLPAALLWAPVAGQEVDQRAGVLLLSVVLGIFLGLVQWARESRPPAAPPGLPEEPTS